MVALDLVGAHLWDPRRYPVLSGHEVDEEVQPSAGADLLDARVGLVPIAQRRSDALAALGRAPAFFLANVVGDFLGTGRFAAAIVLALAVLALSGIGYLNRERLVRLFGGDG